MRAVPLLVACAVLSFAGLTACGSSEPEVPDVVGQDEADARAALEDEGLEVEVDQSFSDEEAGTVTGQSHAAGSTLAEGTAVRIDVSAGPDVLDPTGLTDAYGEIVGLCLASSFAPLEFKQRAEIREHLQGIVATAESGADVTSSDGLTAEEILFEVAGTLKDCDEALSLEAQAGIDGLN